MEIDEEVSLILVKSYYEKECTIDGDGVIERLTNLNLVKENTIKDIR